MHELICITAGAVGINLTISQSETLGNKNFLTFHSMERTLI